MVHIRMPEKLRDALQGVAEANKRSMNAEIVARLEDSLASQTPLNSNELNALLWAFFKHMLTHEGNKFHFDTRDDPELSKVVSKWINGYLVDEVAKREKGKK